MPVFTPYGSDTFARADAPNLGPDWVVAAGDQPIAIVSNLAQATVSIAEELWNVTPIPPDMYAQVTYRGVVVGTADINIVLRATDDPTPGACWLFGFSTGITGAYISDNLGTFEFDFDLPQVLQVNDVILCYVFGLEAGVYVNNVLVGKTTLPARAPTGGVNGGQAGLELFKSQVNDWIVGSVTPALERNEMPTQCKSITVSGVTEVTAPCVASAFDLVSAATFKFQYCDSTGAPVGDAVDAIDNGGSADFRIPVISERNTLFTTDELIGRITSGAGPVYVIPTAK